MSWIVIGEDKGRIKLVSSKEETGLLPKGSFLTIEQGNSKFILRVDESCQNEAYHPSPLIVDMDLSGLLQDRKCQNIVFTYRVKDINNRIDGKIDFIFPQSKARRSSQEEVDIALGVGTSGPKVFLATIQSGNNQILIDDEGEYITAHLPESIFFHQMLICGKTGSGKTVATKYLAQYFVEELEGSVLAINVKDVDFLRMNLPSTSKNQRVKKEWESLEKKPHGIDNFVVYYPATSGISQYQGIDQSYFESITLSVEDITPEALTGLLQGISDSAAQSLPDIFRYWFSKERSTGERFHDFVEYFIQQSEDGGHFRALNLRGDTLDIPLHPSTVKNVQRSLIRAAGFFDNKGAKCLSEQDILRPGQMSVINVEKGAMDFGSIVLRHLLHRIVEANSKAIEKKPILIIIDEVHNFYNTDSGQDALGDLATICRQGRSQKIGVIFSSQNPGDMPQGLSTVINTKIFFKSDFAASKLHVSGITNEEFDSLQQGFAVGTVHDVSQLRILKFPLALSGVID